MSNLLGLGVFGTFGKPYGFQQYFYFDAVFNQTLDLNTNAIEIFPTTELYSVKREIFNGKYSICICKYTYANETNSNRGGTFIGSCILLNETYTSSDNIYSLLEELHNDLITSKKNILNLTLQVQQATQLEVKEPTHFETIKSQLKQLKGTDFCSKDINQSQKILIIPNVNGDKVAQIKTFIENSIEYFNDVDTLYFTFDENVIDYVNKKGLLKSINWKMFLDIKENLIKERTEKIRLENGKRKILDKSKFNNNKNRTNDDFTTWTYKKQKWQSNEVKNRVEEYNRLFEYCLILQNHKTDQSIDQVQKHYNFERSHVYKEDSLFESNKTLIFFILNIVFIVFVLMYLLLFNKPEVRYVKGSSSNIEQCEFENANVTEESTVKFILNPTPNSELNLNDRTLLAKIGFKNKNGRDLIKLIFSQNPTDIQSHFKGQEDLYLKELVYQNKECFKKEDDSVICISDELEHIPTYKKDN